MILVCGHNNAWQLTYRFDAVTRGAVNRVREVHRSAAGKGVNVARVLAALEAPATLLAYLGGPNGARVRQELERHGIAADVIGTAADTRTCVTLLETAMPIGDTGPGSLASGGPGAAGAESGDGGGDGARQVEEPGEPAVAATAAELAGGTVAEARQVTELVEPAVVASDAEQERFAAAYDRLLERARVVVIAGSAIGGARREVYAEMVRRARRRGVPTLLDAYHGHGQAALAASPAIVKINRAELAELAGTPVDTETARVAAYRLLCDRHGVQWVMVSAGAEGIEACDGRRLLRAAAPAVPVVNSIGSGDAASAGVAAALVRAAGVPAKGAEAVSRAATGAAPARLRIEHADLAAGARLAVACGTANCLTATPGSVARDVVRKLLARVTVTETPV